LRLYPNVGSATKPACFHARCRLKTAGERISDCVVNCFCRTLFCDCRTLGVRQNNRGARSKLRAHCVAQRSRRVVRRASTYEELTPRRSYEDSYSVTAFGKLALSRKIPIVASRPSRMAPGLNAPQRVFRSAVYRRLRQWPRLANNRNGAIVWVTCFVAIRLILEEVSGKVQATDIVLGLALLIPIAFPIGGLNWLAISVLSLYVILFSVGHLRAVAWSHHSLGRDHADALEPSLVPIFCQCNSKH